jgi:hypothetical protein
MNVEKMLNELIEIYEKSNVFIQIQDSVFNEDEYDALYQISFSNKAGDAIVVLFGEKDESLSLSVVHKCLGDKEKALELAPIILEFFETYGEKRGFNVLVASKLSFYMYIGRKFCDEFFQRYNYKELPKENAENPYNHRLWCGGMEEGWIKEKEENFIKLHTIENVMEKIGESFSSYQKKDVTFEFVHNGFPYYVKVYYMGETRNIYFSFTPSAIQIIEGPSIDNFHDIEPTIHIWLHSIYQKYRIKAKLNPSTYHYEEMMSFILRETHETFRKENVYQQLLRFFSPYELEEVCAKSKYDWYADYTKEEGFSFFKIGHIICFIDTVKEKIISIEPETKKEELYETFKKRVLATLTRRMEKEKNKFF